MKKVMEDKFLCFLVCLAVGVVIGILLFVLTKRRMFFALGPAFGLLISFLIQSGK